jgi:hypothetical protein
VRGERWGRGREHEYEYEYEYEQRIERDEHGIGDDGAGWRAVAVHGGVHERRGVRDGDLPRVSGEGSAALHAALRHGRGLSAAFARVQHDGALQGAVIPRS